MILGSLDVISLFNKGAVQPFKKQTAFQLKCGLRQQSISALTAVHLLVGQTDVVH